jgi:hypothetical protein
MLIAIYRILFLSLVLGVLNVFDLQASVLGDSAQVKPLKHYIRPCVYLNHYGTSNRRNEDKKQYRFAQNNIGFYLPLHTKTWLREDSVSVASFHVLGLVDMIRYKPQLSFVNESYRIGRLSAGVRLFYSNGKKSVIYYTIAPFVSQEFQYFTRRPRGRFTSAFVYSRTVSKKFAYRLGFARTYTFGRALHLPILGIRVGELDKLHLNVQFPRNISLDFPVSKKVWGSAFSKSMGGIYNIKTQDSLLAPAGTLATLKRFELLNGVQFNVRASDNVSFYVSTGFATRRNVSFEFKDENGTKTDEDRVLEKIPKSLFLSFGLSIHFGKAKRVYNNSTMYDMFDLNTINKMGFNETGTSDNNVPADPEKYKTDQIKNLKYKDVEDLVTEDY